MHDIYRPVESLFRNRVDPEEEITIAIIGSDNIPSPQLLSQYRRERLQRVLFLPDRSHFPRLHSVAKCNYKAR